MINMMTNPEIRAKYRDEIYRFYFSEFSSTLKKIGFRGKIPTMLDFRVELLRWSVVDLIQSMNMVNMQYIDPSKFDYNKMAEDPKGALEDMLQMITECEPFQQHIRESVKRLMVQGTLE